MSLRANVVAAVVTACAALILAIMLLEDPLLEYGQTRQASRELKAAAELADRQIAAGSAPDQVADRVGARTACRVTVWDSGGAALGDTALDGAALARLGPPDGADLAAARRLGTGVATLEVDGHERLSVIIFGAEGRTVRASRPSATIAAARQVVRELLLVGGVIAGGAAVLLTMVLSRTMVRPIEELTRTADALAQGNLDVRTRSRGGDELGRLGRALDAMADQLQERLESMRAEEARLVAMLEGMVEGVFVTDRKGRLVRTNRALDALIGGDALGRTVVEAIRSAELHDAVTEALGGTRQSVELEVRVGFEVRALAAQVAPLPARGGVVAVLHDVTEAKRADRVRRDFVANASHELRTPLTAIRGYAETLRSGALEDREHAARFVETILRHSVRLQGLVDDLLALSRAESPEQPLELEPVDVVPTVLEILSDIGAHRRERVTLRAENLEGLPPAQANRWALERVLVNLIDNAMKYTPDGGEVVVRGHADEKHVTVEVSDTGPGIPARSREQIFERFYRLDEGRSRDKGGTGLGLAIVKHLTQGMGAEIALDSAAGRGSTFRLRLPRATKA